MFNSCLNVISFKKKHFQSVKRTSSESIFKLTESDTKWHIIVKWTGNQAQFSSSLTQEKLESVVCNQDALGTFHFSCHSLNNKYE